MADDTPLDVFARRLRYKNEPLQSLLRAYKVAAMSEHWDTLDDIERAIWKLRESEIEKLVTFAKAPVPTGPSEPNT